MGNTYYTNRDDKNLEKIRALCAELPPVVTEFFVGIQMRTSSLTRLNYAYDLRIFFDFLTKRKLKGIRIDEIVPGRSETGNGIRYRTVPRLPLLLYFSRPSISLRRKSKNAKIVDNPRLFQILF